MDEEIEKAILVGEEMREAARKADLTPMTYLRILQTEIVDICRRTEAPVEALKHVKDVMDYTLNAYLEDLKAMEAKDGQH